MNIKGIMYGAIIGDCVGAYREFFPRFTANKYPLNKNNYRDKLDVFGHRYGFWTDDTTMAIIISRSILDNTIHKPDIIMNEFYQWKTYGKYSSSGVCFDIGNATAIAIDDYHNEKHNENYKNSLGNGALMRIYPFAFVNKDELIADHVRLTHGEKTVNVCLHFIEIIRMIDKFKSKEKVIDFINEKLYILPTDYKHVPNSGYYLDTFIAALYYFLNYDSFEDGLFSAVNNGGDTDTIASVYGALAGAYYDTETLEPFMDSIQKRWSIDMLIKDFDKLIKFNTGENKNG